MSRVSLAVPPPRESHAANALVALSVVIPTLNEAARIGDAVAAVSWADEVIVVDGGSTDETARVAEAAGARVLVVAGETIAAQRNSGISIARNEWILSLDADERVSTVLRHEVAIVIGSQQPTRAAYRIKFRTQYLGRELEHGPWGRDWHVRLFKRDRRYIPSRVHERLEPIDDVGRLAGEILHCPYRDLSHHVAKIGRYARWGAEDLRARARRPSISDVTIRPAWRFVRDYFVMMGWRDGMPGFIAAVLSAINVFLKYAFLYTGPQNDGG